MLSRALAQTAAIIGILILCSITVFADEAEMVSVVLSNEEPIDTDTSDLIFEDKRRWLSTGSLGKRDAKWIGNGMFGKRERWVAGKRYEDSGKQRVWKVAPGAWGKRSRPWKGEESGKRLLKVASGAFGKRSPVLIAPMDDIEFGQVVRR